VSIFIEEAEEEVIAVSLDVGGLSGVERGKEARRVDLPVPFHDKTVDVPGIVLVCAGLWV
jgi:hypothetical protein